MCKTCENINSFLTSKKHLHMFTRVISSLSLRSSDMCKICQPLFGKWKPLHTHTPTHIPPFAIFYGFLVPKYFEKVCELGGKDQQNYLFWKCLTQWDLIICPRTLIFKQQLITWANFRFANSTILVSIQLSVSQNSYEGQKI